MPLTSQNQLTDDCCEGVPAVGWHRNRGKRSSLVAAILLLGPVALPAPAFAQHGMMNGAFGTMLNQGSQPYYQSPPSQYDQQQYQSYQPQPYQQYQQQQTGSYYEDTRPQPRRKSAAAKRKAQTPVAAAPASNGVITVQMKKTGGTFEVPARINNTTTLNFTVDSGSADVMIPIDVVSALIKSGTLKQEDYIGGQTFTLADGSKLPSVRFKLASLQVGDQTFTDVVASVAPSAGSALLGESFLTRFASWTLDNTTGTLTLTMRSANLEQAAVADTPSSAPSPAPAASAAPVTTPAQQADATKSSTGDSAPEKVAAVSTALSPSPDASAHPGLALPAFPDQTKYADARAHLIALGYEPQEVQACDPNSKSCFPERVSCFGTDVIQCKFEWKHGDTAILVQTVDYPPTIATVECEKNCQ